MEDLMGTAEVAQYLGVHEKQVYVLLRERGLPATKVTGKWVFSTRLVAGWLEKGGRADHVYAQLFQRDRPQRLHLLEHLLASLELHCGDRLAVMTLRRCDFEQTGASEDETENLINESLRLASIEAAILLTESSRCVRVSFRSRGRLDVAKLAADFGGGGHARAAGCRADEEIDSLKHRLIEACSRALSTGD